MPTSNERDQKTAITYLCMYVCMHVCLYVRQVNAAVVEMFTGTNQQRTHFFAGP